jgi:hypothetical protein
MTHKRKWNPIGNLGIFGKIRKKRKKDGEIEETASNDQAEKENVSLK